MSHTQASFGAACGCIGPQNGEPLCPCQMRGVQILNGRYVKTQDLGPAPNGGMPKRWFEKPLIEPQKREGTRIRDLVTGHDLGRAD